MPPHDHVATGGPALLTVVAVVALALGAAAYAAGLRAARSRSPWPVRRTLSWYAGLLRALPPARARRVSAVLRSPVPRVVGHPVVAGLLDAGGLWLLYTTGLFHL